MRDLSRSGQAAGDGLAVRRHRLLTRRCRGRAPRRRALLVDEFLHVATFDAPLRACPQKPRKLDPVLTRECASRRSGLHPPLG